MGGQLYGLAVVWPGSCMAWQLYGRAAVRLYEGAAESRVVGEGYREEREGGVAKASERSTPWYSSL